MAYRPFTGIEPMFFLIAGGTGTGKSRSAMRFARGLVGPKGKIAAGDTESGRLQAMKRYEEFHHDLIVPPFRWTAAADWVEDAEARGADVAILDSTSMFEVGPGGMRDWVEEETTRALEKKKRFEPLIDVDDPDVREKYRWSARSLPSQDRQRATYSFLQRRIPIIFVVRARRVTEKQGNKIVPIGWQPIIHDEFRWDLTAAFMLQGEDENGKAPPKPGLISYDDPKKINVEHRSIFREGAQVDEEMGAAMMALMRAQAKAADGPPAFEVERVDGARVGLKDIAGLVSWWDRASREAPAEALRTLRQKNAESMSRYAEENPKEIEAIRIGVAKALGETPPPADDGEEDGGQAEAPEFPGDRALPEDGRLPL
jgi:hypothetical protein